MDKFDEKDGPKRVLKFDESKRSHKPKDTSQLPWSKEVEQGLLGAILMEPEKLSQVIDLVIPRDFYMQANQVLFYTMVKLFNKGETLDLVPLSTALNDLFPEEKSGGLRYVADLMERTAHARNVQSYAQVVRDYANRRKLIESLYQGIEDLYDPQQDALDIATAKMDIMSQVLSQNTKASTGMHIKETAKKLLEKYIAISEGNPPPMGAPTGFSSLDSCLCGLFPSDLVILAARPSIGKTAFALNVSRHVAKTEGAVGFFSLEMGQDQLAERLICSESGIDSQKIREGALDEDEVVRLLIATGTVSELPIMINQTSGISIPAIRAQMKLWQMKTKLKLVVVDYLQLATGSGDIREQEIASISRGLKAIAKDFEVPVLALSQLNRKVENRVDKVPQLSDLRESGSLEQDADVVMFIHRETDEAGKIGPDTQIFVAKQRKGPLGVFNLFYDDATTTFKELGGRSKRSRAERYTAAETETGGRPF